MKRKILLPITVWAGFIFCSCSYSPYVEFPVEIPTDSVSFKNQIEPIFIEQGCTGCHPSTANLDLTTGNAYASLMAKAGRVDIANPSASLIVTEPDPSSDHTKKYTAQQAVLVLTWIEQGAHYTADPIVVPTDSLSYTDEIEPIFSAQGCTECHNPYETLDLTEGNSFSSLMEVVGRVDILNPASSSILTEPASTGSHPKKYTAQQELNVLTWIQQGAHYDEKPVVIRTDTLIFEDDIEPIFTAQACVMCHPTDANLDLTVGKALASLMEVAGRVDTLNPGSSLIVTIPTSKGTHPKKYTAQQQQDVLTWIEQGAQHVEIPVDPISFSAQIIPIFSTQGCTGCHPSSAGLDLTAANAYTSLMAIEGVVDISNPSASLLVTKPISSGSHYKKYTAQDDLLVLTWIQEGAKDN